MVDALDLAELQGVDRQAHVAVSSEPGTVVLVVGLVSVAHPVAFHTAVAANIKNGRQRPILFQGAIEISRHVEARPGFEHDVFHHDAQFGVLVAAGDLRLQRRSRRERLQAEHFEQLAPQPVLRLVPVFPGLDIGQGAGGEPLGFRFEKLRDHRVADGGLGGDVPKFGARKRGGKHEKSGTEKGAFHGLSFINRRLPETKPGFAGWSLFGQPDRSIRKRATPNRVGSGSQPCWVGDPVGLRWPRPTGGKPSRPRRRSRAGKAV